MISIPISRSTFYKLLPTFLILGCGVSHGATFLTDFGTNASGGYPGGASVWNAYTNEAAITGTMKDNTESTAAGVSINVVSGSTIKSSGNSGVNVFDNSTGGPSWATTDGSLANTSAVQDYLFTSTTDGSFSMTIGFAGLTMGDKVSLDVWLSRVTGSPAGFFDYSLDDGANWIGFQVLNKDGTAATNNGWNTNDTLSQRFEGKSDGNDNARYMSSGTVTLTGTTLRVRTTDDAGTNWSGFGAMRLTTAIPEPSVALLGAFGALALLRRRR